MMTGVIRVIAVNQAETLVAVGFSTGAISLIESRTGTLVASWKGGDTEITCVCIENIIYWTYSNFDINFIDEILY